MDIIKKQQDILKAIDETNDIAVKDALYAEYKLYERAAASTVKKQAIDNEQEALAEFDQLLQTAIVKDAGKSTKEQVEARVWSQHPELFERYLRAQRAVIE